MSASESEKLYMLNLIKEMEGYADTIKNKLHTLTISERMKIGKRMGVIVKEMMDFRKRYPDD